MSQSDIAIQCSGLGKRYKRGERASYQRLTETLAALPMLPIRMAKSAFSKPDLASDAGWFWALKDIDLEVKRGEVLGIIGRNGAGKSTFLKVLSRITEPTAGHANLYGRVGSLLEVGTGFHPELTGRENVFLNGAVLGMTRPEIRSKFDAIVEFAEIEEFLDTPVKRYSSGMQTRLGFAVAAHLEPEILIVDEVLAVGDAQFQKKCLGKMQDVANSGRTVLFVSHNMGAVGSLCQRTVVLDGGKCVADGPTDESIQRYLDTGADVQSSVDFEHDENLAVCIDQVSITAVGKKPGQLLDLNDTLEIDIHFSVKADITHVHLSLAIKKHGAVVFRSWDTDFFPELLLKRTAGKYRATAQIPARTLPPAQYSVYAAAGQPSIGSIVAHDDCLSFDIENISEDGTHKSFTRDCMVIVPVKWDVQSQ